MTENSQQLKKIHNWFRSLSKKFEFWNFSGITQIKECIKRKKKLELISISYLPCGKYILKERKKREFGKNIQISMIEVYKFTIKNVKQL